MIRGLCKCFNEYWSDEFQHPQIHSKVQQTILQRHTLLQGPCISTLENCFSKDKMLYAVQKIPFRQPLASLQTSFK